MTTRDTATTSRAPIGWGSGSTGPGPTTTTVARAPGRRTTASTAAGPHPLSDELIGPVVEGDDESNGEDPSVEFPEIRSTSAAASGRVHRSGQRPAHPNTRPQRTITVASARASDDAPRVRVARFRGRGAGDRRHSDHTHPAPRPLSPHAARDPEGVGDDPLDPSSSGTFGIAPETPYGFPGSTPRHDQRRRAGVRS